MFRRKTHPDKREKVKTERGFSPEEVVEGGELLGSRLNERYPTQRVEYYWFDNYVWEVPVDIETERLVTAYKSRKAKRRYGR